MIAELVEYKKTQFPDDRRRILACGIPNGNIHVEWLVPAAPGVDVKWETHLYGLVLAGQREEAIRVLRESRGMSRAEATRRVAEMASQLKVA